MPKLEVLIIGGGLVAGGSQPGVYSHAHAIINHEAFSLKAFIEQDVNQAFALRKTWQVATYPDHESVPFETIDCIVICTPDVNHEEQLFKALSYQPKLVICEKPLSLSPDAGKRVMDAYQAAQIPLIVNYSRRFLEEYRILRNRILEDEHLSTTIYYAKGIQHNGVHALDLLTWYYGPMQSFQIFGVNYDYQDFDPTVSCSLQSKSHNQIVLQGLDTNAFTHFEIDIFTKKSRFRVYQDHSVLEVYRVQNELGIPKGRRLKLESTHKVNHAVSLDGLYRQGLQNFLNGAGLGTDLKQVIEVESLAYDIANQARIMKPYEKLSPDLQAV